MMRFGFILALTAVLGLIFGSLGYVVWQSFTPVGWYR